MVKAIDAVRSVASSLSSVPLSFSRTLFKQDVSRLCTSLKADYNEDVMDKVLSTYDENFRRGAVLWKATNRPKDGIAFRFYERRKVDVVSPAIKHGLLRDHHAMIPVISSWANLYPSAITSCDFDPARGLSKTWIWLGGRRPVDELLKAPHVPKAIGALEGKLKSIGLDTVRHAAVDWRSSTVNIYFWVRGPLGLEKANDLIALSGAGPINEQKLSEIQPFLRREGFTFATTINAHTGDFKRVAIYALQLDNDRLPAVGDRLATFFREAKSYDKRDMNIVAWSFGGGSTGVSDYIKGERSYGGNLEEVLGGWGSPMQANKL
jgi:4-hydroxyphenylpyruvate 3-dimethylallyltransferase